MTMGYRNKMSMFEATFGFDGVFLVPAALFIIAAGENPHEVVADSIIYFFDRDRIFRSSYYAYCDNQSISLFCRTGS